MRIGVLVKQVPDTWEERRLDPALRRTDRSGALVADEVGEQALEVALTCKDVDRSIEVVVVTMGPPSAQDVVRGGLAMGADRGVHVVDEALVGADLIATATVLAEVVRSEGFDLVVTGAQSTDGEGGVLPAVLAEMLGLPVLSGLAAVQLTGTRSAGGQVTGTRAVEAGSVQVAATLPAVVSVTGQLPPARTAGLRGVLAAKRRPILRTGLAELGLAAIPPSTSLLSLTVAPRRAASRVLVDDGGAAAQIVEFLAARHLI
ncbi:MAG: electron transfer flavoprotein subunit beta/FixA family protein [Actinobacteria bacterium]|nr:electron transfer flavoprotein subunit beta/FixA family protein [Actinomycetota bacterium]MCG2803331.1 electron transfer flavoprotein subunit beta/FixA family protein [Cellulomonas sp.]